MSDLTAPCGHVEAAKGGIHKGESAGDGLDNLQDIRSSSIGCPRCDHLASEVMRLRQDRNEWRAMYIELIALLYALGLRSPQKCPACLSIGTSKPD